MNFLEEVAGESRRGFEFERRSLIDRLRKANEVALIAEVKRRSPSQGEIRQVDAAKAAAEMESAGACAISVLTEGRHFGGCLQDLSEVKRRVGVPVLRKDFIVDANQLNESVLYGADAVLLIAAILKDETSRFVDEAHKVGLECLVEVHDEDDLVHALDCSAVLVGVNNRSLSTMEVDLSATERLAREIPKNRIIVAESGVATREDVLRMKNAGAKAILVGTSIMKANSITEKIRELLGR